MLAGVLQVKPACPRVPVTPDGLSGRGFVSGRSTSSGPCACRCTADRISQCAWMIPLRSACSMSAESSILPRSGPKETRSWARTMVTVTRACRRRAGFRIGSGNVGTLVPTSGLLMDRVPPLRLTTAHRHNPAKRTPWTAPSSEGAVHADRRPASRRSDSSLQPRCGVGHADSGKFSL